MRECLSDLVNGFNEQAIIWALMKLSDVKTSLEMKLLFIFLIKIILKRSNDFYVMIKIGVHVLVC